MNDEKEIAMIALIGLPLIIAIMTIFEGIVFCYYWHWFVVSYFGVKEITIVHSIAFMTLIGFSTKQIDTVKSEYKDQRLSIMVAILLMKCVFAFVLGFILSFFV